MGTDCYSSAERRLLLSLARDAIAAGISGRRPTMPEDLPSALLEQRSCFVSLHVRAGGHLRGCIGSLAAHEPLALNVAGNAHNAAFEDPRFPAVSSLEELAGLEIEISVLTPARPIASPAEFEVGRHGIILRVAGRSAVFLPQVAPEQGWDRETTLVHLGLKAGLAPNAWQRPDARFLVFEAIVFSESSEPPIHDHR